jgi:hypothetical protein
MKFKELFLPAIVTATLALGACVTLAPVPPAAPAEVETKHSVATCSERPLRKVVVTAFPLRYPEQIRSGEFMGWPHMAAEDLARQIGQRGRLLGAAAALRFPFVSIETAPAVERPALTRWASQERAQYVIAGMFRDFGTTSKALIVPVRQLVIEAYIYDGFSGELLAQREFARQMRFSGPLPKTVLPGNEEFRQSRLGGVYQELLAELGDWVESTVTCLPFAARVIQVDGRRLVMDVGSESGLAVGTELVLTRTAANNQKTTTGEALAGTRQRIATAIVKSVQPRHSMAEIVPQMRTPAAQIGDVLYGR